MSRRSVIGGLRRGLASVLAVMFIGVCMLGSAKEAEAATTTKAYYVPTKATRVRTYNDGSTYKSTVDFKYYTGDRAGLLKQQVMDGDYKLVLSRNGKGLVTNFKVYYGGSTTPDATA